MKNLHSLLDLDVFSATFREARLIMMGLEGGPKGPKQTPAQKEAAEQGADFLKQLQSSPDQLKEWNRAKGNATKQQQQIAKWLLLPKGGGFTKTTTTDEFSGAKTTVIRHGTTRNKYSKQRMIQLAKDMHTYVLKAEKIQPKGMNERQKKLIKSIDNKVQKTVASMVQKYIFPQTGVAVDKEKNATTARKALNGFLKPKGMNATVQLKLMGQQLVTQVNYVSGSAIEPHINTPQKRASFIKNLQSLKFSA